MIAKPHYLQGCSARLQERGDASSSPYAGNSDYAWNVNFNNGNSNANNRNDVGFVRAVRGPVAASEYQGAGTQAVSLRSLYDAMRKARKQKVASHNQLKFESNWIDGLLLLLSQLIAGTWKPTGTTCFVAQQPKAREIHAPDFADRVVHHWLVPQLEAIYERRFIYDSFSNRKGKGTHAAVERLSSQIRQVHSGQGGGWYLQLDIHNFFNSIHRPTLWTMLKPRMVKAGLPEIAQRAAHALIQHALDANRVSYRASAQERALVPLHKRLENAAPGCGLPIGNLSSQFFANVYLDALDQFVKHALKVPRYVRYVDDFVLVHESREQLEIWQAQIEEFLHQKLRLKLKPDIKLRPLTAGCDFLGYVIYPTHLRVRRRVVQHAREKLIAWSQAHITDRGARCTPAQYRQLGSIWGSYQGHFAHASSWKLQRQFHERFPWLDPLTRTQRRFDHRLESKTITLRA